MKMISENFAIKINRNGRRIIAILLCAVMIISTVPQLISLASETVSDSSGNSKSFSLTSATVGKGKTVGNNYILAVSTGDVAGKRILYFTINYKDKGGYSRTQEVFPTNAKRYGYKKSLNIGDTSSTEKNILSKYLGYNVFSTTGISDESIEALLSNRSDQLYFTTMYPIDEVVSITINSQYKTETTSDEKNEWGCLEFALYKVDQNYGIGNTGALSGDFRVLFSGKLLCTLATKGSTTGSSYAFTWNGIGKTSIEIEKSSKKVNYYLSDKNTDYSNIEAETKYLEIELADTYDAALASYSQILFNSSGGFAISNFGKTVKTQSTSFKECLAVTLKYKDKNGNNKTVKIPFIHSALETLVEAVVGSGENPENITGYAGVFMQGTSLVVPVTLDDFASAVSVSIKLGSQNNFDEEFSLFNSSDNALTQTDEKISIASCHLYDGNSKPSFKLNGGVVEYDFATDPSYVYVARNYSGYDIPADSAAVTLSMSAYEKGDKLTPSITGSTYIIGLKTDDIEGSVTNNDIYVSLEYEKTNNSTETTDYFNIKDCSADFYGYTGAVETGSSTNQITPLDAKSVVCGNFATGYRVNHSEFVYFYVNLENVSTFTGANIKLGSDIAKDEWQCSGFEIYKARDVGRLTYTVADKISTYKYSDTDSSGNENIYSANRLSDRNFDGTQFISYVDPFLIRPGETKHLDFSDSSVDNKDVNWEDYEYYMSYEQSKIDLGFTDTRATYEVSVHVGKDVSSDGVDGDCGSKNQFYFQLVFTDGKSGYVLANQQLSSDGFRTGATETFKIKLNREYGDLSAIRIIPEDPNDDSDSFDKLKIDYIEVAKVENTGISIKWTVDINGWISIDYTDTAAQGSIQGQTGRSESEIARTYTVTDVGYSVNLLVAVTTTSAEGFPGSLVADITYLNKDDVSVTTQVDIVDAMYEYAELSVENSVTIDGTSRAVSSPGFMFRDYHTDRFFIRLGDLKSIVSMTIYPYSSKSGSLSISNVSVFTVSETGSLILNRNQEYEVSSSKTLLAQSSAEGYTIGFDANLQTNGRMIEFTENKLQIDDALGNHTAVIDRVPKNKDDKLNLYVYMADSAASVSNYDMKYALSYTVDYGIYDSGEVVDKIYKTSGTMKTDTNGNMFYVADISAAGITNISNLELRADSYNYIKANVKYAIVEHVRSGVCIETYYFSFLSPNAYYSGCSSAPLAGVYNSYNTGSQMVEFQLTDESKELLLSKGTDDIVVSLKYTALDGTTSHVLASPNEFLSDTSSDSIKAGGVYRVYFNQPNVTNITGISFTAQGDCAGNVGIQYAYAVNYRTDDVTGEDTIDGYYSFASGITKLRTTTATTLCTASDKDNGDNTVSVSPVEITIKTKDAQNSVESGTNAKINLRISYYDSTGNIKTRNISDISDYIVSGSTETGETVTLRIMIPSFKSLRSAEIEPYDYNAENICGWSPEYIKVSYIVDGESFALTRSITERAVENNPVNVNLSEGSLSVTAVSYNSVTKKHYNKVITPSSENIDAILMNADEKLTVTPEVSGSSLSVSYACYRQIGEKYVAADEYLTVNGTSNDIRSLVFTAPEVSENEVFLIKVTSKEFTSLTVSVEIVVSAKQEETTVEETTVEETTVEETTAEETISENTVIDETTISESEEITTAPEQTTLPEAAIED